MWALAIVRLVAGVCVHAMRWVVGAGGYSGLKYLLAARLDLATDLLPPALPALLGGLRDSDDDVRAASADALVPVAPTLLEAGEQVGGSLGAREEREPGRVHGRNGGGRTRRCVCV